MTKVNRYAAAAMLLTLMGCNSPTSPSELFRGGVVVTFDVVGESFKAWILNPVAIEQALALRDGASSATIPVSRIRRGPGRGSYNAPYRWHVDANEIEFAEAAVEVCDGTPSFVEENVDYFIDDVKTYCPWSAELVALEDYR